MVLSLHNYHKDRRQMKRKTSHKKCLKWQYSTVRSVKTATVWIEDGAFPLFFRPHHGTFSPLFQRPGICHPRQKKKNAYARGEGRLRAVGFDRCIKRAGKIMKFHIDQTEARRAEKIFETAPSLPPCLDDRPLSLSEGLDNRSFVSQARRTRHFALSARRGEEENKALFFSSPRLALRARFASL